jgi:hypothetical protein
MKTRVKQGHAGQEQPRAGDYFVLDTRGEWYHVDGETAARLREHSIETSC